jgi:hypothetical protein
VEASLGLSELGNHAIAPSEEYDCHQSETNPDPILLFGLTLHGGKTLLILRSIII